MTTHMCPRGCSIHNPAQVDAITTWLATPVATITQQQTSDPARAEQRERIEAAIRQAATQGTIDPNHVRVLLSDKQNNLLVPAQLIGSVYHQLARDGVIEWTGTYVDSTDLKSRNRGKQLKTWRLV